MLCSVFYEKTYKLITNILGCQHGREYFRKLQQKICKSVSNNVMLLCRQEIKNYTNESKIIKIYWDQNSSVKKDSPTPMIDSFHFWIAYKLAKVSNIYDRREVLDKKSKQNTEKFSFNQNKTS